MGGSGIAVASDGSIALLSGSAAQRGQAAVAYLFSFYINQGQYNACPQEIRVRACFGRAFPNCSHSSGNQQDCSVLGNTLRDEPEVRSNLGDMNGCMRVAAGSGSSVGAGVGVGVRAVRGRVSGPGGRIWAGGNWCADGAGAGAGQDHQWPGAPQGRAG